MTAAERASEMAAQGAAEHRAATPPALVLPDGWEQVDWTCDETGERTYYQTGGGRYGGAQVVVDMDDISLSSGPALDADEARIVAARLVEAAAIVEQLRAGAS